ncbi:hypothetical protein OEA41_008802 [Lepraria neglecta]|uniref:Cytochrome P450 n=1 Tax=Lepraria neglecta TaxID=209136 RepID=A0AAE0DH86_9LECA|nr:hypothetical protein OEA41_008802 [Lepraria neglecta]
MIRDRQVLADLKRRNGCEEPMNYPHKDPLLGLDLFFAMGKAMQSGQMLNLNKKLFETYGRTFQFKSWGTNVISTREPRNIQTVLALAFDNFGVEPVKQKESGGSLMAKGIFTADGAIWARSRALIRPTFARPQISSFESLELHVKQLLDCIPRDGTAIDLQPLFKRMFLDTSTEFLFGESVNCLSPETSFRSSQFLESFDTSMHGLAARMQLGKLAFIRGRDTHWKNAVRQVHEFIDSHVERVLRQRKSHDTVDNNNVAGKGQSRRYILLDEMANETQDPMDLRYQLLHVFFPAHDATGIAVSDMLFHLARDPNRWRKLQSETLAVISSGPYSFELLKSMKYMRYVFNERIGLKQPGLRLHPLAGMVRRVCHKDTVLPLGGGVDGKAPIFVKRGTRVVMNIHALHRDQDLWGHDADDFRPERWESARPVWEYLPFSGGPRICPAQQMVFTEAAYIVARMTQEFSTVENVDPEPWTERFRMTVESRNGVKVRMICD